MKKRLKKKFDSKAEFEKALKNKQEENYVLRLFITGMTPRSTEALASVRSVCEKHLSGHYDLEVIDLYQEPALAGEEQIIAAPTLVKKFPAPLRRLVGNLSEEERVLTGLGLQKAS